ncbi:hypothetical protein ACFP51_19350 [Streptomyces pratens]|uniref:GNAT family N-acetyltransferase n=1 Tax=Streptomyces pratens TaxID=887456 RepID=A0ABW1LW50_9ACTN
MSSATQAPARISPSASEDHASRLGYKVLHLSTGVLQPDAIRFYERKGYARTEGYGPYVGHPLAVCFARRLVCD